MTSTPPTITTRAALYLRVSTARQAEHDVSIPDQKRQGEAWCAARGYELVETYVEPGASATNDRRPEFQRMIEAGTSKPAPFDVLVVHSFSRFFRDHFELEFYVRKLAKNGVKLVSITQEMGDDPMHVMMRQIMALFDEYQSKETAKHVLRAMRENARQGFWNGSLPPIGYRTVIAEQRGAKAKKKIEIDPFHAETVRLMFRLASQGDGENGPMGVKAIAAWLNANAIATPRRRPLGLRRGSHGIDPQDLHRASRIQPLRQGAQTQSRFGVRDRRCAHNHRSGNLRCGAGPDEGAKPQGRTATGGRRPHPPYRPDPLRQMRRRHDHPHRQGRALSLLHLLDKGTAGPDQLQRYDRADGKARRSRRQPSGGTPAPARAAGKHPVCGSGPQAGA